MKLSVQDIMYTWDWAMMKVGSESLFSDIGLLLYTTFFSDAKVYMLFVVDREKYWPNPKKPCVIRHKDEARRGEIKIQLKITNSFMCLESQMQEYVITPYFIQHARVHISSPED